MAKIRLLVSSGEYGYQMLAIYIDETHAYGSSTELAFAQYGLSSKKCVLRRPALALVV